MADKIQTRRNARNKKKFEKRQGYDIAKLSKQKYGRLKSRQQITANDSAIEYMDHNCLYWW